MFSHPWADHVKLITVWDSNPRLDLRVGGQVDLHSAGKHLPAQWGVPGLAAKLKSSLYPHQVGQAAPCVVLQGLVDHLERHAQPRSNGVGWDPGSGGGGHGAVLVHQAVAYCVVEHQPEGTLGY